VTSAGFFEVTLENVTVQDGTNPIPPITVTSAPPAGSFRIVLTWGETPSDLDSHLTGPDGSGGRFHVYYASRQPVPFANLDRDDVSSFGPETITVEPRHPGTYRYSVHNFTQRNNPAEAAGGIHSSPTRVEVYSSQGLVRAFTAPAPPANIQANTWRVFEMAQNGTITPINTYVNASSASDMNTFRTATGEKAPEPAAVD